MSKGFFITGTDTDAGKTWVAAGLIARLRRQGHRVAAMKPVSCGCRVTKEGLRNADADILMQHASVNLRYDHVNPYAFEAAVAPHLAAAHKGQRIDIAVIKKIFSEITRQADYTIVEGVGGWKVPLNETETAADMARALDLPVILVVGMRLGCLNHALLTSDAITRDGLTLAGWVANTVAPHTALLEENIDALKERIPAPLLGSIPHLTGLQTQMIADCLSPL